MVETRAELLEQLLRGVIPQAPAGSMVVVVLIEPSNDGYFARTAGTVPPDALAAVMHAVADGIDTGAGEIGTRPLVTQ